MRIQCPSCRARFKLADNKIPTDGVKVRCSRCKHVFRVLPDPPTVVQRAKISDVHDATLGPSGIYADRPDPSSLFASDDPFAAMGAGGDDAMPFASGEPSGPASRHKKHNRTMQGAAARNLLNRPQDASQQARSQAVQALKKPTPRADPFRMSDPFQDGSPGRGDQASLSDVLGGGGGSGSRGLKQTQALGSHRSETLIRPGDNDDPFAPDALGGGDEFAAFFAEGGGG
ncbi:MAG: zinc-ribbon domain-containing protein, partial [Myxococcota bacterium]